MTKEQEDELLDDPQPAESYALKAELARLTECLSKANANHERFERLAYLMEDERDKMREERDIAVENHFAAIGRAEDAESKLQISDDLQTQWQAAAEKYLEERDIETLRLDWLESEKAAFGYNVELGAWVFDFEGDSAATLRELIDSEMAGRAAGAGVGRYASATEKEANAKLSDLPG